MKYAIIRETNYTEDETWLFCYKFDIEYMNTMCKFKNLINAECLNLKMWISDVRPSARYLPKTFYMKNLNHEGVISKEEMLKISQSLSCETCKVTPYMGLSADDEYWFYKGLTRNETFSCPHFQ